MAPRESNTVELIKRHLVRRYGAYIIKTHGDHKRAGLPDLVCCLRGRFVAIEVKAPGAKRGATRKQRVELERITRRGGIAFVAASVSDVDRALLEL